MHARACMHAVAVADSAAVRTVCNTRSVAVRSFRSTEIDCYRKLIASVPRKLIATFVSYFGTSWAGPLGTIKS